MEQVKKSRSINIKYALIHGVFFADNALILGFTAVFLYSLGLTNAQVGIVVGVSAALPIFVQPFVIGLIQRSKWLTMRKALLLVRLLTVVLYELMAFVKIPVALVMVLYILVQTLFYSEPTFMSEMGSGYIRQGYKVRFEIARGVASGAYAIMAALIGLLVEKYTTGIMGYLFLGLSAALAVVIYFMDEIPREAAAPSLAKNKKKITFSEFTKANKALVMIAVGFCFLYASFIVQVTYAIDVVKEFGRGEADLGTLTLIWGLSEVPVMFGFSWLVKKIKCINLLKICALAYFLKTVILAFAPSYGWVCAGYLLQSFSFGLWIPAYVYYINNHVAHEYQPTAHSVVGMATVGVAGFVGNYLGGLMTGLYGIMPMIKGSCIVSLAGLVIVLCINSKKASTLNLLKD